MAIAAIVNEIDAYLLCLRHARDLLLAPMTEAPRESEPRRKRAVKATRTGRPLSSKPRIRGNKSRFDRMVAPTTTPKQRLDSGSRVRGSVAPQEAIPQQMPVAVTVQKPQQYLRIERVPASDQPMFSTRTVRRPVTKRAFGTILEKSKPAIALAGPVHSKIVVVSVEQAQRERERAAQSEVRRPCPPATGLTGKLAFEALFNDGNDTSKTPRQ
jgi:hypothetical protein